MLTMDKLGIFHWELPDVTLALLPENAYTMLMGNGGKPCQRFIQTLRTRRPQTISAERDTWF